MLPQPPVTKKCSTRPDLRLFFALLSVLLSSLPLNAQRQMEALDRGLVAIPKASNSVFVSWRLLGTEAPDLAFNLYRIANNGIPEKLNDSPLVQGTCFTDTTVQLGVPNRYFVRAVSGGAEQTASRAFALPANAPVRPYLPIPLTVPAPMTMPDNSTCIYSPSDCSTGDLDGDGQYEIIVKWDPSNAQDNSKSGYTGNVYLDAYKMDGTRLWRIDLGRNIRAGAHYTQFQVYDLDGDGRAEIACKTSDGTIDGVGRVIGDGSRDHRNSSGTILSGPEYLTVFAGATGAALTTIDYVPRRHPSTSNPSGSQLDAVWGDNYGNRVDRFLACVAYLDGKRPSLVMCRGYYTRAVLVAYDFRGGILSQRWIFDSTDGIPGNKAYEGQGNHNLSVGDVDEDGKDEIVYGSCTIDDDGKGLYNTLLGHGDAMHLSDLDPTRPGLEVWSCHEDYDGNGGIGLSFRDARTGAVLWSVPSTRDAGRGVAIDIDPRYPGYECWGAVGGLNSAQGAQISASRPGSMNFAAWWDGDLLREILDGNRIDKWNYTTGTVTNLVTATGASSNNGTKATPNLSADILGDWREEVIWRSDDNTELRIYSTTLPTEHRFRTLMHDPQYRLAIAWQNSAYNQPPHPGFFLGDGMAPAPAPAITTALDSSASQLSALAVRTQAGAGENTLIVGFISDGGPSLPLVIRGIGPSLADAVSGFMPDPKLSLYRHLVNLPIDTNDDWWSVPNASQVMPYLQSRGLAPAQSTSKDAILALDLAPGIYTVHVTAASGGSGIAQADIYAFDTSPTKRLYGLAARARAGAGDDRLIAGFVLSGPSSKKILIRAIGPGMADVVGGAHPDPVLELYQGTNRIMANDNWSHYGDPVSDLDGAQFMGLKAGSKDAALLVTLPPGAYTAHCYGADGKPGILQLEVYETN